MKLLNRIIFLSVLYVFVVSLIYKEENKECDSKRTYDKKEFCLPVITGMTEAYDIPVVKLATDAYKFDKENTILGLYVKTGSLDRNISKGFDNYYKVYALKKLEGRKVSKKMFSIIREQFISDSNSISWKDVQKDIEKKFSQLKIGTPIVLDKYHLNSFLSTQILLLKTINDGKEKIQVCSLSIASIRNTIIYFCFYKAYAGVDTINMVKANNDLFGHKLVLNNKGE